MAQENLIKTNIVPFFYDMDLDDDVNALLAGLEGKNNSVNIIKRNRKKPLVQFIIVDTDNNREKLAMAYNFNSPKKGYRDLFE